MCDKFAAVLWISQREMPADFVAPNWPVQA
jgi:hypothetical protein